MREIGRKKKSPRLSGSLLVAHPVLVDPNFRRTVVLIAVHTSEEGAHGVVINRPLSKKLEEFDNDFAFGPLAKVPLYYGGPVKQDQMILTAWKWSSESRAFQLFFGITAEKAAEMLTAEPDLDVRGFLGYAGWTEGQLEGELGKRAWVVSPIDGRILKSTPDKSLWRNILITVNPDLKILADAPEDPSTN